VSGLAIFSKPSGKADENVGQSKVDAFLEKATGRPQGVGRLIFAIDATASRGPTWDMARGLMGDMVREVSSIGRLEMQLVYFRGGSDGREECSASNWTMDAAQFAKTMAGVDCKAGYTQISRALGHARREAAKTRVGAVVLIGDGCEPIEDNLDRLLPEASELGRLKTPVFAFLEGYSPEAEAGFRKIAELSGGAFGRFDAGGVNQLGELLRAAALVAVGGPQALDGRKDETSALLLRRMRRNG
jgi:hypothetical protein